MVKKMKILVMSIARFFFVDSLRYLVGDRLKPRWLMWWAFVGWGWLSILVMITSLVTTISQL